MRAAMRLGLCAGLLPIVALAACDKGSKTVTAENASVAEVAEKVAAAGKEDSAFSPGKWSATAKVISVDMPGLPPQAQQAMKDAMSQSATHESCITPEQAKKPDPKMFGGESNNCRYDSFTMGGGKMDAVMTCKGDRGEAMKMTVNGTYSPESYAMATAMTMSSPTDPTKQMAIKVEANGKRIGDCTGAEPKAGTQ